ncbi:MAG: LegC family aminotransferase [Desulfarculus sp.]|nr:LegC family aminotransferase [Desulfarculus sp.]
MSTPFEPGAPAGQGFIPLCVPEVRGHEWAYIKECLDTGWVSSVGKYVTRFEEQIATRLGAGQAVAFTSGTAALHVALMLAEVGPDDEVVLPSLTFIAPAFAVRYLGAWPVLADVDPRHWQMDVEQVRGFLTEGCRRQGGQVINQATGRRVKALLPVDLMGHPADMDPFMELAGEFGLTVVEDATESLGALYKGRPAGRLGHTGVLSFNGNKVITTGGGGMLVTDNPALANRARYLSTQAKDDPLEYVHNTVGFNYRLSNIQAAMGCAQLESLNDYVAAKRRIQQTYREGLAGVPGLGFMEQAPWAGSACWMSPILVDPAAYGQDSRSLLKALHGQGIQTRPLWQPLHQSPALAGSFSLGCPVSERLYQQGLCLPCSVGLTPSDQELVIGAIAAGQGGGSQAA